MPMGTSQATWGRFLQTLQCFPVMARFHPLVPLALPLEVWIPETAEEAIATLDSLAFHPTQPLLVPADIRYSHRFLWLEIPHPPIEEINAHLPARFAEARRWILSQQNVVKRILTDVKHQEYQTVILFLIDGLSYGEAGNWIERGVCLEPCLVEGPSVTFLRNESGHILPNVGFPALVGDPPLALRLRELGFQRVRGFSYWDREANELTEVLFRGIPLQRITVFDEAMAMLEKEELRGTYVQILRQGLDRLAHRQREVTPAERQAVITSIHEDVQKVVHLLREKELPGVIYLVADHGILWRDEHNLLIGEVERREHSRYGRKPIYGAGERQATIWGRGKEQWWLYHYPYISRPLRSDEAGVHGGISYHESIVPFARWEVLP